MRYAMVVLFASLALSVSAIGQEPTAQLDQAWRDLAGADAVKAYQAIGVFLKTPAEAVRVFEAKLPPASPPDRAQIERWIEDLGSGRFVVREKANAELEKLGCLIEPALRAAIEKDLSVETRQRVDKLLDTIAGPVTLPEELRQLRAVETLEHIGTDTARQLLKRYAEGAAASLLTREAKDALARMAKAPPPLPRTNETTTDLYGDPLPKGTIARMGTVRFRGDVDAYSHDPGCLRFTPDGKTILVASGSQVQGWDIRTGQRTLDVQLSRDPAFGRRLAMSADGRRVAIVCYSEPIGKQPGSSEIRVFDFPSAKMIRAFPQSGEYAQPSIAFSPDGKLLFSFDSRAGLARVEEIETGNELAKEKFARDSGAGVDVSPDGEIVAVPSGVNSRKLSLWNWRDKVPPRELPLQQYGIDEATFSPDGKLLAGVDNDHRLMIWDVVSGQMIHEQRCQEKGFYYRDAMIFSPDGKMLAIQLGGRGSFGRNIHLLDPSTGALKRALDDAAHLAFSSDSKLAAVTTGTAVRILDLTTGKELSERAECHDQAPVLLGATANDTLVTSGYDGHVRIWDAATSRLRFKWLLNRLVFGMAVSPDGRLIAASSLDDFVHVWDISRGEELYRLAGHGQNGGRRPVVFTPDSSRLISFGDDYDLRGWDMKTGRAVFEHRIRPDGAELANLKELGERFEKGMLDSALSRDGTSLLVQTFPACFLFETATGKQNAKVAVDRRFFRASLGLSHDGKSLLGSVNDQDRNHQHMITTIEISSGKEIRRKVLPGSTTGRMALSGDGRTLVTAIEEPDRQIVLMEKATGNIRGTLRGFSGRVRGLTFFPDCRRLASSHSDATVLIWDLGRVEPWEKGR